MQKSISYDSSKMNRFEFQHDPQFFKLVSKSLFSWFDQNVVTQLHDCATLYTLFLLLSKFR